MGSPEIPGLERAQGPRSSGVGVGEGTVRGVPKVPDWALEEAAVSPTLRAWGREAERGDPEITDAGLERWQGVPEI